MQGWHDTTQTILQILSNPAWGGIGVIIVPYFLSLPFFLPEILKPVDLKNRKACIIPQVK